MPQTTNGVSATRLRGSLEQKFLIQPESTPVMDRDRRGRDMVDWTSFR